MNKFSALEGQQQEYDAETLKTLNSWRHKVRMAPKKDRKPASEIAAVEQKNKSAKCEVPRGDDKSQQRCVASSLPPRAARKVGKWELKNDEIIAIFDTGSFTHAIDADKVLPDFKVDQCDSDAPGTSAEPAGEDVLRKLGTVRTATTIDGVDVDIKWDHMKVNTPILSVRKLVEEGNEVHLDGSGGFIRHLKSGKTMNIQFPRCLLLEDKVSCIHRPVRPLSTPSWHQLLVKTKDSNYQGLPTWLPSLRMYSGRSQTM